MGDKPSSQNVVILLGASAVVAGTYLALKKPPAIRLGDTVTLSSVQFLYKGTRASLFINWGLKAGTGDFNNGQNLQGGVWASGGPLDVMSSADFVKYTFRLKDMKQRPNLRLDPAFFRQTTYDTYIWLTLNKPSVDERDIIAIDTDAEAVKIVE